MSEITYDLSSINNINLKECIKNNDFNKLKINTKQWMKNNKVYNIIKYDKDYLTDDNFNSIGLLRSLIYSNDKIHVFSPPKSLKNNIFTNEYDFSECKAEEFVEGTMINMFYDSDIQTWEIASKSSIGANVKYFKDQPSFSELFMEICGHINLNLENFCKDYCYSFVMQHPKNKFAIPIIKKRLVLIGIYKINNDTFQITEIPKESEIEKLGNIELPKKYEMTSYDDMIETYASMNTDINILGVMIYHTSGIRTKFRNPNYEYLRHLRGNSSKIQFKYLSLRKVDQVKTYLRFFPEDKKQFSVFRVQLHLFTNNLYSNYIKCYIKKEKPLGEFPKQFRTHMYNLHQHYLQIRPDKGYINKQTVIDYINNLDSSILMYALNYHLRNITSSLQDNNDNDNNDNNEEQKMELDNQSR